MVGSCGCHHRVPQARANNSPSRSDQIWPGPWFMQARLCSFCLQIGIVGAANSTTQLLQDEDLVDAALCSSLGFVLSIRAAGPLMPLRLLAGPDCAPMAGIDCAARGLVLTIQTRRLSSRKPWFEAVLKDETDG
jgi:hypothetical protein